MVMLHLGTALALLLFFYRDWLQLIAGFVRAKGGGGNPEARLMWRLIAGTIPAGLLGLLLEKQLRVLFSSATAVLDFLSINGLLLLLGERLGQRRAHKSLDELSIAGAIKIGSGQALALLPGISRSGITLLSGLAHGLDHASAARFSFLLATPIILAAGVLEIPKLAHAGHAQPWVCYLAAVPLPARRRRQHLVSHALFQEKRNRIAAPFGWYCLLFGLGGLAYRLV
jgi:undecaprenyl-diphosphatase